MKPLTAIETNEQEALSESVSQDQDQFKEELEDAFIQEVQNLNGGLFIADMTVARYFFYMGISYGSGSIIEKVESRAEQLNRRLERIAEHMLVDRMLAQRRTRRNPDQAAEASEWNAQAAIETLRRNKKQP